MNAYKEFRNRFKKVSDKQLIGAFNREVGNKGWTTSRASYLAALHQEFEDRGYNYQSIGDKTGLSFKRKVKLVGKEIEIVEKG